MKRNNGYVFCGKFVPGMGAVGCDKEWKCMQCGSCLEGRNNAPRENKQNKNNEITPENNNNYVIIPPYSNISKIKIDNISKVDIDNLF